MSSFEYPDCLRIKEGIRSLEQVDPFDKTIESNKHIDAYYPRIDSMTPCLPWINYETIERNVVERSRPRLRTRANRNNFFRTFSREPEKQQ